MNQSLSKTLGVARKIRGDGWTRRLPLASEVLGSAPHGIPGIAPTAKMRTICSHSLDNTQDNAQTEAFLHQKERDLSTKPRIFISRSSRIETCHCAALRSNFLLTFQWYSAEGAKAIKCPFAPPTFGYAVVLAKSGPWDDSAVDNVASPENPLSPAANDIASRMLVSVASDSRS